MRVFVYRNLHKNCWSVRSCETGRVVFHADAVWIMDATFSVGTKGRERVLREKKKNVHAGVRGTLSGYKNSDGIEGQWFKFGEGAVSTGGVEVYYNPYKVATFVRKADSTPIHAADGVMLQGNGTVVAVRPST